MCRMMRISCSCIQLLQEESFSVLTLLLSLDYEPTSVIYDGKTSLQKANCSPICNLTSQWSGEQQLNFQQSKILKFTIGEKKYV